jgi:hypothetical protein
VDADGATRIADLENLEARITQYRKAWQGNTPLLNGNRGVAIGSRHAPQAQVRVVVQQRWLVRLYGCHSDWLFCRSSSKMLSCSATRHET